MVNNTCLTQDLSAGTARARGLSRSVHLLFLIDKENSTVSAVAVPSLGAVCNSAVCSSSWCAMAARSDCSSSSARSSSAGDHRIHQSSFVAGM